MARPTSGRCARSNRARRRSFAPWRASVSRSSSCCDPPTTGPCAILARDCRLERFYRVFLERPTVRDASMSCLRALEEVKASSGVEPALTKTRPFAFKCQLPWWSNTRLSRRSISVHTPRYSSAPYVSSRFSRQLDEYDCCPCATGSPPLRRVGRSFTIVEA